MTAEDGLDLTVEELQAESDARLSQADTARKDSPAPEADEHAETSEDATPGAEPKDTPGENAQAPAAQRSREIDAIPEALRELLADVPDDALVEIGKGYMRREDYDRKNQERAGAQQDAESYRQLMGNPETRKAILRAMAGEDAQPEPKEEPEPIDWTQASSEEIDKAITERARQIAREELRSRVEQPLERLEQIKVKAREYRQEVGTDVQDEAFRAAFVAMVDEYGEDSLTPDNVVLLLKPFVEIEKLKSRLDSAGKSSAGLSRATSTPGRGGAAPAPQPKQLNGDASEADRMAATLSRVERMTGARMTAKDLDDLLKESL